MSSIVKVDTIQENTSANGITVDGLNIKDSKLVTANSVVTSNITDANVTLAKLAGDSVDATKIADDAVSEEHLDVTAITGHGALTSVADGDHVLISDTSASAALKKITVANLVAGAGGGKIGQVIYGSTTSAYNSNSTSYTDTSLTAAITPSATSSKVVVFVSQAGDFVNGDANGTNRVSYMALFRGSGEIAGQKQSCQYQFGGYNVPISFSFSVLDAPSTTNETTYKTMCKIDNAAEQHINLQQGTSRSQMILMEVLA